MNNKRLVAEIVKKNAEPCWIDGNLLHCEFEAFDRGNITDIVNWGIYVNRGSISFVDILGYFINQNEPLDHKNIIVRFYLFWGTRLSLISTFYVDSIDVNSENMTVNMELISTLIELQNKPSSFYNRSAYTFSEKSAYYLLGLDVPASEKTLDVSKLTEDQIDALISLIQSMQKE